ncbi:MAG TPA: HD domain-containing phosphohydrolase, partial [Thermodesulfovibrionales bacterium]|nr:HD domain-containing phosphohydrolase [Thermodesulfovibrionales bacterium]
EQDAVRKAGILHDIGKIGVTTDLLCKEGKLTCDELEAIKRHTIIGEDICRPLVSMRGILSAIRSHHERWDGKGFPDGLQGEEIPINARILSIVDSFDAMISQRPYRNGRSMDVVISVFRDEKHAGQWDPSLLDQFVEMMGVMQDERISGWSSLQ